jgi:GT2 family glycosyltransferase
MTADLDVAPAGQAARTLPAGSVFWACIHGENVRGGFLASVVGMLTGPYAELVGSFYDLASGPVLSIARNTCAEALLASKQEWLWFVDCDTVFRPDVLPRLMALADPVERPVVAAAVPISGKDPSREFGGLPDLFWSAYHYTDRDGERGLEPISCAAEVGECQQVDAVGTGCVLIHRSVFEALGPGAFNEMGEGNAVMGEDLAFCHRCDALGIPVHFAGRLRVGHAKVVTL